MPSTFTIDLNTTNFASVPSLRFVILLARDLEHWRLFRWLSRLLCLRRWIWAAGLGMDSSAALPEARAHDLDRQREDVGVLYRAPDLLQSIWYLQVSGAFSSPTHTFMRISLPRLWRFAPTPTLSLALVAAFTFDLLLSFPILIIFIFVSTTCLPPRHAYTQEWFQSNLEFVCNWGKVRNWSQKWKIVKDEISIYPHALFDIYWSLLSV